VRSGDGIYQQPRCLESRWQRSFAPRGLGLHKIVVPPFRSCTRHSMKANGTHSTERRRS
jgi:hypothetical protein